LINHNWSTIDINHEIQYLSKNILMCKDKDKGIELICI